MTKTALFAPNNMDKKPLFDEDKDFVNVDHIHEFAKALVWEEEEANEEKAEEKDRLERSDQSEPSLSSTEVKEDIAREKENAKEVDAVEGDQFPPGVHPLKISSKSDWYPMMRSKQNHKPNKKHKKRQTKSPKKLKNEFRSSASYTLLRWPILVVVVGWICILCTLYALIRAYVALYEYWFTWTGERKRLRDKLRLSDTYEEWVENALVLDNFLHLEKWSEIDKFSFYDSHTVKLTTSKLKKLRLAGDDAALAVILQGCLKKNFAGIENRQLYSHRYYGTKKLVDEYVDEVTECINIVTNSSTIPFEDKRRFFRIVLKNYGTTALCLSGGACFAYTHLGVVKALLDNNLLPSIISGTSGGGLIAALACTRTDDELKKLLVPELARKITACEDPWYVWIPRWWKTGARFDSVDWAKKSNFFTRGSTTFAEAFARTERVLNISTVPADPHSPVILCNNITSPNCIIWSSLLASSAVPGILNPVVLMMKDPHNDAVVPFSFGSKWRDGSLRTDIPIDALNTYYNVNFSVVSQVNPHISLFFYAPKGAVGRPVPVPRSRTHKEKYASLRGGFLATALEQLCKLEIKKWLQIIKSLDLLPHFLEQDWLSIWLQTFTGSITIWPRNRVKEFWYILSDPTEERLADQIKKGERCMFPKLLFIKHRLSIERAIEKGRKLTKLSTAYNDMPGSGDDLRASFHDESDSSDDEVLKHVRSLKEDEDFVSSGSETEEHSIIQTLFGNHARRNTIT